MISSLHFSCAYLIHCPSPFSLLSLVVNHLQCRVCTTVVPDVFPTLTEVVMRPPSATPTASTSTTTSSGLVWMSSLKARETIGVVFICVLLIDGDVNLKKWIISAVSPPHPIQWHSLSVTHSSTSCHRPLIFPLSSR